MFTKTSKGYKTETLKSDAEYHTENHESPQYVDIFLRSYGQNNMAETGFNVPMYLISLNIMLQIRIYFICTTSRLHLV